MNSRTLSVGLTWILFDVPRVLEYSSWDSLFLRHVQGSFLILLNSSELLCIIL